ncbi:uncharacterized protein LOC107009533 isoform X1 [Solanum pennellii]|uniref:Uncharacterized protein LOC107009533 isoform X1 n=1 Tax=Solanum pennellii TaxID=28526 RepID=A0ABM1G0X3_SOLPN|nr:uncharacterized protein LOC107009533 isoform X1 [Solanum pennellii]
MPSVENIADWFGLGKDFAYWCQESRIAFRDLYIRFGHASFYSTYNREFKLSYREWNEIRPLAFDVALLGTMVFSHGTSLRYEHTLFKWYENQGITKNYPIAPVILPDMYRALGKCKEGHRYFQGCNLLLQWLILSDLAKGARTPKLHTLDNKKTLKYLNDMLYWANMNNRITRGRWAQIFSESREEDPQWMLDRFISKEVVVESCRKIVLPLPGIREIHPLMSCDSSKGDKLYPKRCNMVLMYMILETIECTTSLKYSENGKVSSVWIKTPFPLADSMMDMTRVTKNG